MSEKIKYTDEPLGDLRVIPDFLPRPEELVFRDKGGENKGQRTISLTETSKKPVAKVEGD